MLLNTSSNEIRVFILGFSVPQCLPSFLYLPSYSCLSPEPFFTYTKDAFSPRRSVGSPVPELKIIEQCSLPSVPGYSLYSLRKQVASKFLEDNTGVDIELGKKPHIKTNANAGMTSCKVGGFKNSENREALLIAYTQRLSPRAQRDFG